MTHLQILDLSHNSLSKIEFLPETLTELYISHNCLSEIPSLPLLLTLDISHNKISNLQFLSASIELQLLNASYNELEDPILALSHIKMCSKLVLLDIKGCPFKPQHRLIFVSTFINTLQEINGVPITQEEKKKAIEEQEISFDVTPISFMKYHHSVKSSIGSQDNLTLSPSPGGSWDTRARNQIFPSIRGSLTHTAQTSVDLTVFDRKTPRNSMAAIMSPYNESAQNEPMRSPNLRFTSSPDNQKHTLTSNLNSPLPAEYSSRFGSSAFLPLQPDHLRSFSGTNMSPFPNLTEKSMISEGNPQYEHSPLDRKLFENITPKKNLVHTFSMPGQMNSDRSDKNIIKSDTVSVINRDYKEQAGEDFEIQEKLLKLEEETRELIKPGNLLLQTYDTESSGMSKDLDRIYNTMVENMKSDSHRFKTSSKDKSLPPKHPKRSKLVKEEFDFATEESRRSQGRASSNERKVLGAISNFENQRRKSHCCKHRHHSKSRKKSVKLQTNLESLRESEKDHRPKSVKLQTNFESFRENEKEHHPKLRISTKSPMLIDQATSPPHIYTSSLLEKYKKKDVFELAQSFSSFESDLKPLDDLPPISTGRDSRASFITETENHLGATFSMEQRSRTPTMKIDQNVDFDQILVYAQTPPRPILASEASVPIIHELSQKGGEFYLICQLFLKECCEVKSVTKTYTFTLQRELKDELDFYSSGRALDYTKTCLMFHSGTPTQLDMLCRSPEGFKFYMHDTESLLFSPSLRNIDDLYARKNKTTMKGLRQVVISVLTSGSLHKKYGNIYSLDDWTKAIPAYLVQYQIK